MFKQYYDLLANVRRDGQFHSVRKLIQPDDPLVQDVANVLVQGRDFIGAAQDFVNQFTTYKTEIGDYWGYPMETMAFRYGDCDDKAILLTSILRNYLPADQVFCGIGVWNTKGTDDGHMWVVTTDKNGLDRVVESTAPSSRSLQGRYRLAALFNDHYAFATQRGLDEFALRAIPLGSELARKEIRV